MYIVVNVRRDNSGLYAAGYDKLIPTDVRILGMYVDEEPGQPDTKQTLLRISHPDLGMLGIAETEQSLADRINAALCCDSSGALAQLAPPVLDTPVAGDQEITTPFALVTDATGYQAQASSDDFVTIAGTGASTGTPITISNLTNGGVYKVRVRATAAGFSPSDWTEAAGTFTPAALPAAAPPTAPVVDDTANTFGFTLSPDALLGGHEVSILGGAYAPVTANPIAIGNVAIPPGGVLVRVAAVPGVSAASSTITNATAYNVAVIQGYFIQKLDDTNPTEGEILAGTPFTITDGQDYTITIPNIGLRNIMVFEPSTQPEKTLVNDTLGDAAINGENAFGQVVTVTTFRGYKTNYQTAFDTALTFKID